MTSVLVVCTANICRSPVGEALIREKIAHFGLEGWSVSSAGTWAVEGRPASAYSAQCLAERGLDISAHTAQKITARQLAIADLVLCMELGHKEALQVEFPQHRNKIFVISEMVGLKTSIRDPYGGSRADYKAMVTQLAGIIDTGWTHIKELAEKEVAE